MISIVIPTFNEGKNLANFIIDSIKILRDSNLPNWEIIIVNDGSTDDSITFLQKKLEKIGNYSKKIFINNHSINKGYGAALKTGIKMSKYQVCGIIDSDSTYSINDLIKIYFDQKSNNIDMIVGSRKKVLKNEKLSKRFLRKLLLSLSQYMVDQKIADINSGLRVFKKNGLSKNFFLLSDKFSFTTSQTLLFFLQKKTVMYVPVNYNVRKGKTKVKLLRDGVITVGQIITLAAYFNPIKLFFPIIIFSLIANVIAISTILISANAQNTILFLIQINLFLLIVVLSISLHVIGYLARSKNLTTNEL